MLTAFYGGLSVDLLKKYGSDSWTLENLYQYQYSTSYYPAPSLDGATLTLPYTSTSYRYGYTVFAAPIPWEHVGGIAKLFQEHVTAKRLASRSASSTANCRVTDTTALAHQLVLGTCAATARLVDSEEANVCDGLTDEYALYHSSTYLYARTSSSASVYAGNIIALDVMEEAA
jgi:hypothetical protein